jgi:hypothetical protein
MERLTKEEALQRCKKQWLWAAKTGQHKSYYPFEDGYPDCYCYACEYDEQNDHNFCDESCIVPWPGDGCCDEKSPYFAYLAADSDSKEAKEAALAIVALCDKALEALHEERAFGHDLSQAL